MTATNGAAPSLYHLLDPEVLADPYPLYRMLRTEAPVHWDPYLYAWVVTSYREAVEVLHRLSAQATATPEKLAALGMHELGPIAHVMVRQMLFLDPPQHGRVRRLASVAFTPRQVERLRGHIERIADSLIDAVIAQREMELMDAFANPLPAIVTAEMLGVPASDHRQLKQWSADFAEMLGSFQHNPGRAANVANSLQEMTEYFRAAVRRQAKHPTEGLVNAFTMAELEGDRLTEDEVVANIIITLVGGLETTPNLIGNGLLTLLRHPEEIERLRDNPELIPTAVEELLRYESPSQQTTRVAPEDVNLGGRLIKGGQAVIVVMGAANRDPARFPNPDRLDLERADNRHLAFGWAGHFCFGAPLARIEGQIAFSTLLRRLPKLQLASDKLTWRSNLKLRGLTALQVSF
jgi:cytochrome P450